MIVTIAEAIRFKKIKNYVSNRFHKNQTVTWECFENIINNWHNLSIQNNQAVSIPHMNALL